MDDFARQGGMQPCPRSLDLTRHASWLTEQETVNVEETSNPIFQRNLAALSTRTPELARRLAAHVIEQPRRFQLLATEENVPTLVAVTASGQSLSLHHARQPLAETSAWLAGLPKECFRGVNVLILGIGLAYHIQQFASRADAETLITAAEPDLDLFVTVLEQIDLSQLLSSPRITWLVGVSPHETVKHLATGQAGHRLAGQGVQLLSLPGFRAYYAEYLRTLTEEIQSGLIGVGLKSRTARQQGRDITKNILDNLPAVLEAPGVVTLRSIGVGMPAFVVAPGPSLTDQLPTLRDAVRKGFVIAVDTAARILRRRRIPYHFVVAVDYTDLNRLHFDNAGDDPAWLVAYPGVHPAIPALYRERAVFYDHSGDIQKSTRASPLIELIGLTHRLGSLVSAGSTTDAAYHLARSLGCSPIVLVGVDLAFPGERFYAAGAMQDETSIDIPHTSLQYLVPDNRGGQVTTSHIYRLFRDQLAETIRSTGGLAYNTSLEGAAIPGASPMDLPEFITRTPDATPRIPSLPHRSAKSLVTARLQEILDGMSEDRRTLRRWDKEIRRISTQDSRKFRTRLIPVLKEIAAALKSRDSMRLTGSLAEESASEILGQVGGVGLLGGTNSHENEVAKERLRRWIREIHEGIDFASPLFRGALDKI